MPIVIVSGPCGSGKSTVSRLLAENSDRAGVHFHTDDFYQYIRKGYIPPWLEGSGDQNEVVMGAVTAAAERFSAGGYEVFVDGMIGPWFLGSWKELIGRGADVRYVVLRPNEETTLLRAAKREGSPLSAGNIRQIWRSMSDLGEYEAHALDTGAQTAEETAALVQKLLRENHFRLG